MPIKRPHKLKRLNESGNVFSLVFAIVALVGLLTVGLSAYINGPLSSAINVTQNSKIDQQLRVAARVVLAHTVGRADGGNIDTDTFLEPIEFVTDSALGLTGGGTLDPTLGVTRPDPYGSTLGYCVWDHGDDDNGMNDSGGGGTDNRLQGNNDTSSPVVAVISSGRNRAFETGCFAYDGSGSEGVVRPAGSDDFVVEFSPDTVSTDIGGNIGNIWTLSTDLTSATSDDNLQIGVFEADGSVDESVPEAQRRDLIVEGDAEFLSVSLNSIAAASTINAPDSDPINFEDPVGFPIVAGAAMPGRGFFVLFNIDSTGCTDGEAMSTRWNEGDARPELFCP